MPNKNCYATLDAIKDRLSVTGTSDDAALLTLIEVASRGVDDDTGRFFYSRTATEYVNGTDGGVLLMPFDLLSVSSFTEDSEGDGTFDGTTWTEDTDFWLHPRGRFPAWGAVEHPDGSYGFSEDLRDYKIVGIWGYGDGERAAPWDETAITATVADATTATLSLSAEGAIEAGHTILVGSEQMFVSAVTSDDSNLATVTRGVNGTTAAAHTTTTVSTAAYPPLVRQEVLVRAAGLYRTMGADLGLLSEGIGDYRYQRLAPTSQREYERLRVSTLVRVA